MYIMSSKNESDRGDSRSERRPVGKWYFYRCRLRRESNSELVLCGDDFQSQAKRVTGASIHHHGVDRIVGAESNRQNHAFREVAPVESPKPAFVLRYKHFFTKA